MSTRANGPATLLLIVVVMALAIAFYGVACFPASVTTVAWLTSLRWLCYCWSTFPSGCGRAALSQSCGSVASWHDCWIVAGGGRGALPFSRDFDFASCFHWRGTGCGHVGSYVPYIGHCVLRHVHEGEIDDAWFAVECLVRDGVCRGAGRVCAGDQPLRLCLICNGSSLRFTARRVCKPPRHSLSGMRWLPAGQHLFLVPAIASFVGLVSGVACLFLSSIRRRAALAIGIVAALIFFAGLVSIGVATSLERAQRPPFVMFGLAALAVTLASAHALFIAIRYPGSSRDTVC